MDNEKDTQNVWRLIPGRERFFPHYVPGISWSTHLSTLWVLCILPWVRGRRGWTGWIKQTVIPQLSVHGFIQCIWKAVPNSVPTEILFHSLYTKHKNCPTEPFNMWQSNTLKWKMAVCICGTGRSLTLRLLMSYIYIYIYIWSTYSWCF